jgi:hypothetical protein
MGIDLGSLVWNPVVEGRAVVMFVASAIACPECVAAVAGLSDAFVQDEMVRDIVGGRIGNIHWRTKGMDVGLRCNLCQKALPESEFQRMGEELRFRVEVQS